MCEQTTTGVGQANIETPLTDHLADAVGEFRVRITHHHAAPCRRNLLGRLLVGGSRFNGQRYVEFGSAAHFAIDPDPSAVALDDLTDDVETQADAGDLANEADGDLGKPVEDLIPLVARDAVAVVGHANDDLFALCLSRDLDRAAGRAVLDRVGDQIAQDLRDLVCVRLDLRQGLGALDAQADRFALRHGLEYQGAGCHDI